MAAGALGSLYLILSFFSNACRRSIRDVVHGPNPARLKVETTSMNAPFRSVYVAKYLEGHYIDVTEERMTF